LRVLGFTLGGLGVAVGLDGTGVGVAGELDLVESKDVVAAL